MIRIAIEARSFRRECMESSGWICGRRSRPAAKQGSNWNCGGCSIHLNFVEALVGRARPSGSWGNCRGCFGTLLQPVGERREFPSSSRLGRGRSGRPGRWRIRRCRIGRWRLIAGGTLRGGLGGIVRIERVGFVLEGVGGGGKEVSAGAEAETFRGGQWGMGNVELEDASSEVGIRKSEWGRLARRATTEVTMAVDETSANLI